MAQLGWGTSAAMTDQRKPESALATLSHVRFWKPGWIFERKLDGQRCLAGVRSGTRTSLEARSGRAGRDN
jgi:hypothetical protein